MRGRPPLTHSWAECNVNSPRSDSSGGFSSRWLCWPLLFLGFMPCSLIMTSEMWYVKCREGEGGVLVSFDPLI